MLDRILVLCALPLSAGREESRLRELERSSLLSPWEGWAELTRHVCILPQPIERIPVWAGPYLQAQLFHLPLERKHVSVGPQPRDVAAFVVVRRARRALETPTNGAHGARTRTRTGYFLTLRGNAFISTDLTLRVLSLLTRTICVGNKAQGARPFSNG